MAQRDLSEFFDDSLEYTNVKSKAYPDGKTYRIASPDAKTGVWLAALAEVGVRAAAGADIAAEDLNSLKLDDDEEISLYQRVMGPVYDELIEDGVPWTVLQKIGEDAYIYFALSPEVADASLEGSGNQPARPNRAKRRTAQKTAGSKSSRASTATPALTLPDQVSLPSSTSPNEPAAAAEAV